MDGPGTDGSSGNPPVLSGGSNDCCDEGVATFGVRCAGFQGAANGTRRMKKRALEDGAINALLELNSGHTEYVGRAWLGSLCA
jgi:hypothetical protein